MTRAVSGLVKETEKIASFTSSTVVPGRERMNDDLRVVLPWLDYLNVSNGSEFLFYFVAIV